MFVVSQAEFDSQQYQPLNKAFNGFAKRLKEAKTFDEVDKVCRDIDNFDLKMLARCLEEEIGDTKFATPSVFKLAGITLCHELYKHFHASKDLILYKRIMKAVVKPGLLCGFDLPEELLKKKFEPGHLHEYAWFSNGKLMKALNTTFPDAMMDDANSRFRKSETHDQPELSSSDCSLKALTIENYILAIDETGIQPDMSYMFELVMNDLENPHQNIRKLLLELFKRMAMIWMNNDKSDSDMDVIRWLPWNNRNKYALLAILISVDHELVTKDPKFFMSTFLEGLQVGLTMHILYAPSHSLVKAMITKEVFQTHLIELVARVLWDGEDSIVDNLIKFWFSTFEPLVVKKIYKIMSASGKLKDIPTTSKKFHRLLVLRNAFKRTFKDPELDKRVAAFACEFSELSVKTEVFHILIDNVHAEQDQIMRIQNILTLLKFLRQNISIDDSSFVEQHVMRKLPELFNLLATRKFREVEIAKEIFGIIQRDLFKNGMEFGSYESTAFSLKLLHVILKQYFGTGGARLSKNTNIEGNSNFGMYLKDNDIWDLTSTDIFVQLLKLMDEDEHSDLSELATNMLVEYFVKTSLYETVKIGDVPFIDWINQKVKDSFNETEISSTIAAMRFFMLKLECAIAKGSAVHEILLVVDLLKSRFLKLKKEGNPVKSMEEGLHLFKLMDSINFGLKRLDSRELKSSVIPVLNFILKLIAFHFLDFFCKEKETPSFELLDQKLAGLLQKSKIENASDLKPKLVLFIWYTLRSSSEITDSIAKITNATTQPSEEEYQQIMANCIDINIQLLTRCCHKGVIDSASEAIGKITRIISKEFTKLCDRTSENAQALQAFLITLKKEIFASKRPASKTGDVRSSRGLIVMSHEIITGHPAFLKFLMSSLVIQTTVNLVDVQPHERTFSFDPKVLPIQLHLLAFLIRDSELAEHMLRYLDSVLYSTFKAYGQSNDFVLENALLQIVGAIVPKISNQKRSILSDEEVSISYEPKSITTSVFSEKLPCSFTHATSLLSPGSGHLKTAYYIVLLELLSNFETRVFRINPTFNANLICTIRSLQTLMQNENEKVRILAAKCYAQWVLVHDIPKRMFCDIISSIFETHENLIHSTCYAVRFMQQRLEACYKHIGNLDALDGPKSTINLKDMRSNLREAISAGFKKKGFPGATNFYLRYHLLDLLMFAGFPFKHAICQSLMNETGISNHCGYQIWAEKVKDLQK